MRESITADAFVDPFPHIIFHNFYNDEELKLIWEELDFYTKPNKLFLWFESTQYNIHYFHYYLVSLQVFVFSNNFF